MASTDNRLQIFGSLVRGSIDEERRRVEVIASTGEIARDGAIIEPGGWDLREYENNPVVLWAHNDSGMQPPIARTVESRVTDKALIQVHEFDAPGNDAFADTIWRKIVAGMINAVSVRWIPGLTEIRKQAVKDADGKARERDVLVFVKGHRLLETSYVSIPADVGAVIKRADGQPFDLHDFYPDLEPDVAAVATRESRARRLAATAADIRGSIALLRGDRA